MEDVTFFLFGSAARGDTDSASDLDVLAVYTRETSVEFRDGVNVAVRRQYGDRTALAEYSVERIREMFAQGHLFAWHLYFEAKRIYPLIEGVTGNYSFQKPMPYVDGHQDAQRFQDLLRSIELEITTSTAGSEVHEAGLTYLAIRNIAMALSYTCCPRPDFTRYAPFTVSEALGIAPPCNRSTYDLMTRARHSSQRGLSGPTITSWQVEHTVSECLGWAEIAIENTYGK
jgi:predicted nucleotidyltransferase